MRASWLRNAIMLAEARERWDVSLGLLTRASAESGETPTGLRQKGIALFQLERDAEALAMFARADALAATLDEPDAGLPAEAAIAQLYQLRGDRANVQRYLAEALRKYPQSREVIVLSIQARIHDDQLEEARELA